MAEILARAGNHFSHLLHHIVYSFPSPNNTYSGGTDDAQAGGDSSHSGLQAFEGMMDEPGEPRALAGGIGPLSFVGSGYGVMLVLMVCFSCALITVVLR